MAGCQFAASAPLLVCEKDSYDFGEVMSTNRIEHGYILENQGDVPLVFGAVRGCCGASVVVRDAVVSPGSSTVCQVSFSLRGRSGAVSKSLYVASNDPARPQYRLRLTGTVLPSPGDVAIPAAQAEPATPPSPPVPRRDLVAVPSLLILTVSEDEPQAAGRFLAVRSADRKPFLITGAELPRESMTFRVTPLGVGAWRIELNGILPENSLDGATIRLLTDREDQPVITIPIRVVQRPVARVPSP